MLDDARDKSGKQEMPNITEDINSITQFFLALAALVAAIVLFHEQIEKAWNKVLKPSLKPLWNKILKPGVKLIAFLGTLVIPTGAIVWLFLYKAAVNSNRLGEPLVFLFVIAQVTGFTSLYAIIWARWICPWLRPLLLDWVPSILKRKQGVQQSSGGNQASEGSAQRLKIESEDTKHQEYQ